jgi:hypothetical protein
LDCVQLGNGLWYTDRNLANLLLLLLDLVQLFNVLLNSLLNFVQLFNLLLHSTELTNLLLLLLDLVQLFNVLLICKYINYEIQAS